jgi:hypothetical protein
MTETEYKEIVASLQANDRAMLEEMRRVRGASSASELRHVTRGPKTGKPLEYGLTREFDRLQRHGLIRQVAKNPARYEPVPPAEVEEAAGTYRLKKKRTRKRKSSRNRLVELRAYEHGDYSEFYRVHRRVIELSDYVSHQFVKMAFWAAAPKDELARVVDELGELRDAIDAAVACLKQRTDDDDLLAKIAKLENTHGRTAPEAATARALAAKLRNQYDQRVGVLD